ncbi:DUF262 domain-containing protein [Aggregatibacter actinomycetemcomitans]|uniref:DUF262 domain-containing protein n=1 Tax=Aggregatibacter actinomycetemcomitans TaxID=714 RepID=UPI00197BE28F|nr:DUF262 domain-containing protein [Aggregatibacter actinomycetemcomitans]MBN6076759.1 DUF262 domain-containing protein [Aggregatibacter actinomycetemcomitans]MBN6079408.1 DUF262 domain-containing protein [Aggregatibacter actinomycetemcomitans]
MANWKTYRISDVINEIDEGKYVLPVIQRSLVWTEEKMELLFDTLLKGDSFSGVIAIKEEKGKKPLFNYRRFSKTGELVNSKEIDELEQTQFFIIDGQQRLQTFYMGLMGSVNGKYLYFDLYSNYLSEYEFKFEKGKSSLPLLSKDDDRNLSKHLWYEASVLLNKLKDSNDEEQVADELIDDFSIVDEAEREHIRKNVKAFYKNIVSSESLGISIVNVNKTRPDLENRQRIVELFRRLNDGGTKLSSFDLVASVLKGFDWRMEGFLREILSKYSDIGLTQDNLIKLIFILQDNHNKEMANIEEGDANFAIFNKDKIESSLYATKQFLKHARLYDYYKDGSRSFIPLFFIIYHLFHKELEAEEIKLYFDNFETSNSDFIPMKNWLYHSLLNGVFRSRGAGWVSYKTGIRKLLSSIKGFRNQVFPMQILFDVYIQHPLNFELKYTKGSLNNLDSSFIYYLIYDCKESLRVNDIDHIMPKSVLQSYGYSWDKINSIPNYQLLDYSTNRGNKNSSSFYDWVNNEDNVKDKEQYLKIHLIPTDKSLWLEENFEDFIDNRAELIIKKIESYF